MQKKGFFLALCLIVAMSATYAQFTLESRLPDSTVAILTFPNVSKMCEAFQKVGLGAITQEEEVRDFVMAFIEPYKDKIEAEKKKVERQLGMPIEEILKVFHGEVTVAVTSIDPRSRMPLDVVFALDFGPNRATIDKLFELGKMAGMPPVQAVPYGNFTLNLLGPIGFAFVDSTIVVSSNVDSLKKILDNSYPAKLSQKPSYEAAKARTQFGTPAVFFYLDVKQAVSTFSPMISPQEKQIMEMAGAFDLETIAMGTSLDGKHFRDAIFIGIPKTSKFLSKILRSEESVSFDLAKIAPASAVGFSSMRFDLGGFVRFAEEVLSTVDPSGGLSEQYKAMRGQVESSIGFAFADLLESLGSGYHNIKFLPEHGLLPSDVTIVELKDPERFMKVFRRLGELVKADIKSQTYKGQECFYFSKQLGVLGQNPFNPRMDPMESFVSSLGQGFSGISFFSDGKALYLCNHMHDLKSFIDNRGSWSEKNLSANTDFTYAMGQVPAGSTSFFVYYDFRTLFNGWWNTLMPFFRLVDGVAREAGIPFDSTKIPQATTLSRHMVPGFSFYTTDEKGVFFHSASATGGVIFILPIAGVTAAIAIPGLLRARMKANEAAAIGTLRSLVSAQAQFQRACEVDQDGDGTGEYGFLQELAGITFLRGKQKALEYGYLSKSIGMVNERGVVSKSGYYFCCYLPGKDKAILEKLGQQEVNQDAANSQENYFIVYAWPIEYGKTGNRAFAVNQAGEVVACWKRYSLWDMPQPGDALLKLENPTKFENAEGDIAVSSTGNNDEYWFAAN